jgi:hypothetical protein
METTLSGPMAEEEVSEETLYKRMTSSDKGPECPVASVGSTVNESPSGTKEACVGEAYLGNLEGVVEASERILSSCLIPCSRAK